jgi:tRNA-(ms[2]io[6]A)-hydroxylase
MLNLASTTHERWPTEASADLPALLLDHAHCEKKAASTALSLLFRYPEHTALLRPLTALAAEELEHFQRMLDLLEARGVPYRKLTPSLYAGRLFQAVRKEEPGRLVDTLLACSLIEARSCERMKLLSERLEDAALALFYGDLLASEARHHHVYVDLARQVAPTEDIRARLRELAAHEATCIAGVGDDGVRMHNGPLEAE